MKFWWFDRLYSGGEVPRLEGLSELAQRFGATRIGNPTQLRNMDGFHLAFVHFSSAKDLKRADWEAVAGGNVYVVFVGTNPQATENGDEQQWVHNLRLGCAAFARSLTNESTASFRASCGKSSPPDFELLYPRQCDHLVALYLVQLSSARTEEDPSEAVRIAKLESQMRIAAEREYRGAVGNEPFDLKSAVGTRAALMRILNRTQG